MVWVTHDLDQADRLGDHRVVIVAGRPATEREMVRYLADGSVDEGPAADEEDEGPPADEDDDGPPAADGPVDDIPSRRADA